jgi:large repetitive protein
VTSVGLGQPSNPASTLLDAREHPSWRIEMLQRVMNLTTVRTHQYAVWITVGFFEVKRRGDIGMIASGDPRLAFDILGPEVGLRGDRNFRYRGFFLVDRLRLDGFDPTNTSPWHAAVVYRRILQ